LKPNNRSINKLSTTFPTDSFSCDLFPICSGCDRINQVRLPPISLELQEFFAKKGIDFSVSSHNITNWRSRAKLAVRGEVGSPKIGLFSVGTHTVIDMPFCPHHYPVMNQAVALIRKMMIRFDIAPYKEKEHTGRLSYIQMVANREDQKIQLSVVWKTESLSGEEKEFIRALYEESHYFHSIWNNFHPLPSNTVLGKKWELALGEEVFLQKIGGILFSIHPSCFFQAHLEMFEEVLDYLFGSIPHYTSIIELYAGVGCISTCLSSKAKRVYMIESSDFAKKCFETTLSLLPQEEAKKFQFIHSTVEDYDLLPFKEVEVLIVDPPRKGLSTLCKKKIRGLGCGHLFYISCGPSSFMRDCEELIEMGWELRKGRGFLFFPGTNHVEIAAEFFKK